MLKLAVFSDFHYKKRMYAAKVSDLWKILDRAYENHVDFVVHAGDFCNDYAGSPELINTYLANPHGLAVYGVYGNHELEGNHMEFVTHNLCNRVVCFAGKELAYWYTDIKGYRLIGLDTNYSYSNAKGEWEHNYDNSYGWPKGNSMGNSLGPEQLAWLEQLLDATRAEQKKAIVISHLGFGGECKQSPDAPKVRELFAKYANTVILAISGHFHTDHFSVEDNIAFFDCIATINACWKLNDKEHYEDSHTFKFYDFDEKGEETVVYDMKLKDLEQGKNTWFVKEPLNAIITIEDDGTIKVDGCRTEWAYGVVPPFSFDGLKTEISDRCVKIAL